MSTALAAISVLLLAVSDSGAQVEFDSTFTTPGVAPTRTLSGLTDYMIEQGRGRVVTGSGRTNLFHSFARFDLDATQSASFLATQPIDTVIARVTSGVASSIDGRLRSEIPGADLFFVNPAGVLFGSNASLELPASFHVTTADSIVFGDDVSFSSTSPAPTVTAAPPTHFGFLGGGNGTIIVDDVVPMLVPNGETLTLVGHNVTVRNATSLIARNGTVQLGAAGSATVDVPVAVEDWSTRDGDAAELGLVRVGDQVTIRTNLSSAGPGVDQGRIIIRGGRFLGTETVMTAGGRGDGTPAIDIEVAGALEIEDSLISAFGNSSQSTGGIRLVGDQVRLAGGAFGGVRIRTTSSGEAGDLRIEADRLVIEGRESVSTETRGTGRGADVRIVVNELEIDDGSSLRTVASDEGDGGDIEIDADRIDVTTTSQIATRTTSTDPAAGNAGRITVRSNALSLRDGGQISGTTEGAGRAGDVVLRIDGDIEIDGENLGLPSGVFSRSGIAGGASATGDGGLVDIQARDLRLSNGGQIGTGAFGGGDAGGVLVDLSGDLFVAGESGPVMGGSPLRSSISTLAGSGDSGDVTIIADEVVVSDGAAIDSTTQAEGQAGAVSITARRISVSGVSPTGQASRVAAASTLDDLVGSGGSTGRVALTATESITVRDGGVVSAETFGTGATQDILLDSGGLILIDGGGQVSSRARSSSADASAGDIVLRAVDGVRISNGGAVTAESAGLGDAGDIEITADTIDVVRGALTTSSANALGGNLRLAADGFVSFFDSVATTDVRGGAGQGGDILVRAETVVMNASNVTANAAGSATAGNISITATNGFLESTNNILEAENDLGVTGAIVVQGPNAQVVGELSQLPSRFLDAASQLEEACTVRNAPTGTFEIRGPERPFRGLDDFLEPATDDAGGTSSGAMCEDVP